MKPDTSANTFLPRFQRFGDPVVLSSFLEGREPDYLPFVSF